ncbi:MAG: hypothetical protein FJW40_18555 [Acidobacteria bacterium]|nr:hypothetical protein [Acidobacteriota bacterium]
MKYLLAALLSTAALAQDEVPLRAGLAATDITPQALLPMYGYANRRCGPAATATHDPLFAKALILEAGGRKLAIVTLDLGSIVSERIVREAKTRFGLDAVLLAASHTHSAPNFLPPAIQDSPFLPEVESRILDTIARASQAMFPARIGMGKGSLRLGYNRLLPRDDGRSRALFDNLERIPYGPLDPEFQLMRIEDAAGSPKALLVHYAVHSVVLGPTNCEYSADYPGVLQSRIQTALPGVQAMFVQGGAGDINPLFMARTGRRDDDFTVVRKMGETLADAVLRAAAPLRGTPNRHPIKIVSNTLTFDDRWEKGKTLDVGLTTALINGEIAIAATPGEPLHKLQTQWKREADVPWALFYGYTYSGTGIWPGYIPDLRSAAYGGYGADVTTRIQIGAGEAILARHLKELYGLRGMWRDAPGKP